MGLRDTDDPRNSLVDQFARLVAELQPKAFVMENVPGMLRGNARCVLDRAIAFFRCAGYRITQPIRVLDAADFGVPQMRKRLFVIGLREDISGTILYPGGPAPGQPCRPTVWEAIADLPTVEHREELFRQNDVDYDKQPVSPYAQVARGALDDPSDLSLPREWSGVRCTGCLRVRHTPRAAALYAATPPGQMVPGHKLPRLDPDGVCPTLRAGSDSTHGSYTAPRPIHPFESRCITSREAARLHGFPDWFGFYPLKWHAYRQIGNAVCPQVARAIGRQVASALGFEVERPVQCVPLSTDFVLPEDRPRTLKRIPQVVHYPPVVMHLFDRAFDGAQGKLERPRFTFADVQRAIGATGVNLSWTRAETFLSEIARSRNVLQILEPCLSKGYSIRPVRDGRFIGEFVRVGEPGTLEDKELFHVRSRDMADAVPLHLGITLDWREPSALADLLAEPAVVASLWSGANLRLESRALPGVIGNGHRTTYRRWKGGSAVGRGCAVTSSLGTPPDSS